MGKKLLPLSRQKNETVMELRQLKYFMSVAETLNFSESARKLYVTQSTLSQQIRQLEDELGCPLFVRDSHSVKLTEEGEALVPLAERTVLDAMACRSRISDLQKMVTGELNIGLTSSFGILFTDTLRNFLKKYPGVRLNVFYKTATELIEMLRHHELDFYLAFRPAQEQADVETIPLFEYDLCVIMRKEHPLANRQSLSFRDLEHQGLALPSSGMQSRKAFDRFIDVNTTDLNVRVELNDPNVILDLVQSTNLVTILSSQTVRYRSGLKAVPIEGVHRVMQGGIHWLKDDFHKRSAKVFIDMLQESNAIRQMATL